MRSMALWMCLLCIAAYTTWIQADSSSNKPVVSGAVERPQTAQNDVVFIYTKHALERMQQRGANDNEVEDTVRTGEEVPAKGGKQKFEKTYTKSCTYNGKQYPRKKVEVVTAKEDDDWVVITVIADCK